MIEAIQANLVILKPSIYILDCINHVQVVTLHEWLDQYYDIVNSRELREKTLVDYRSKINIIKSKLGDKNILDITPKDIADFINNYKGAPIHRPVRRVQRGNSWRHYKQ
ncbi:tyrosine-type recombinase/integrase [Entomomonas moraniae]|uniref:site-specific integrase n=1 Tax=Entomomonas moraniae TaxID=2213226 RepID=UPI00225E1482|nr:site-specific integrase [Entomomonas moraniae]